jgi:atypical dual specificity phosphatase
MLRNFSFILEGRLAGSAFPGNWGRLDEDLSEAADLGITAVVSLTESPLDQAVVSRMGMKYRHIPVRDWRPPTLDQIRDFVAFVDETSREGGAVLVHCHAGLGRTGTMLAAYLVSQGRDALDAIAEVRSRRPGSIETEEQEDAVIAYERALHDGGR